MRVYRSCRTKEGTGDSTKTDGGRTTQKRPSQSRSKKEQETARTIHETSEKKNNRDKLFKKMNNHNNKKIKRSNNLKNEPDVPYGDSNLEYLYKKEKLLALVEHRKKLLKEKL